MFKKILVLAILIPALGGCFFHGEGGGHHEHHHHHLGKSVDPVHVDADGRGLAFEGREGVHAY